MYAINYQSGTVKSAAIDVKIKQDTYLFETAIVIVVTTSKFLITLPLESNFILTNVRCELQPPELFMRNKATTKSKFVATKIDKKKLY